jgi:hypothetical protein
MEATMGFTNREKADCAKREVTQRKRVYQRQVADGRMKANFAARQIGMMEEIAAEYAAKAEAEEAEGRLI